MGIFSIWANRAERSQPALKVGGATVKKTVCCFCSCGCGMDAYVREGKLIGLEGSEENPINEGTLCSKGAAAAELHRSTDRLIRPLYRPPNAEAWQECDWDWAIGKIAERIKVIRDGTWIEREALDGQVLAANRTDGLGFLGGAINTNEEAYCYKKLATLLGTHSIEHQARI